jgi:hypothetical protein
VVADIGLRIRLDPAIEHIRERRHLSAAAGQVLLQHDGERNGMPGEVGGPALPETVVAYRDTDG